MIRAGIQEIFSRWHTSAPDPQGTAYRQTVDDAIGSAIESTCDYGHAITRDRTDGSSNVAGSRLGSRS